MAGDESTNPAVLVARINRLEDDLAEYNRTLSETRERLNQFQRDKLDRSQFDEWTRNATAWREEVVKHLERIDGRLGLWAVGSVVITLIAATLAAIFGRGP